MSSWCKLLVVPLLALALIVLATLAGAPAVASAADGSSWSGLEQPLPPSGGAWPVGLGKIGDIEFEAPDRGLLITEGEPPTIPAGIWAYNGVEWHEISIVCGATDGRIVWASPGEFWTVSDGRAGQANEIAGNGTEKAIAIQDNTLCHFAHGALVASYAHPANEADSYQAMHAAGCLTPSDCWFAGNQLPEPQVGSFHLHWNGGSLENAPYLGEGHAVEDMNALEGHLYESVRDSPSDRGAESESVIRRINPQGTPPSIQPEEGEFGGGLPFYESGQRPRSLDFMHLSTDGNHLWAAAGRSTEGVESSAQVTVALDTGGEWTQLIGPEHPLGSILASQGEEEALLGEHHSEVNPLEPIARKASVSAVAAEPGTGEAWVALAPHGGSSADPRAVLLHISTSGEVLEEQTLPSTQEEQAGVGPKGAAAKLSCPAAGDCWLATTRGWLFHLAPESARSLPRDSAEGEYFTGLITYRPGDLGLPQVPPDAPPPDDSGLVEAPPNYGGTFQESTPAAESRVTLPLLSHVHSRLLRGSTLELRFHLAVVARLRLIAKRKRKVVAETGTQTFKAGNRKLLLKLDTKRWPTKLSLQSHALAPLPTAPSASGEGINVTTETTGLFVLPKALLGSELPER